MRQVSNRSRNIDDSIHAITQIYLGNDVVTLINVFVVANKQEQNKLLKLLEDVTEKVMRHMDGFVSANLHRSTDGTRVVNYAQWESMESFEAMLRNPDAQKHMARAYQLSRPEPHLYEVVSIYTKKTT
jgi:quinol monooxygenase YgiN